MLLFRSRDKEMNRLLLKECWWCLLKIFKKCFHLIFYFQVGSTIFHIIRLCWVRRSLGPLSLWSQLQLPQLPRHLRLTAGHHWWSSSGGSSCSRPAWSWLSRQWLPPPPWSRSLLWPPGGRQEQTEQENSEIWLSHWPGHLGRQWQWESWLWLDDNSGSEEWIRITMDPRSGSPSSSSLGQTRVTGQSSKVNKQILSSALRASAFK